MQSSTRRKAVLGLCIVTVLIAAVVVFLSSRPGLDSVKPQPAEPEGRSEAEESQHLALESAEVANEVELADEVDEQVLEEHLGSLVEAPDPNRMVGGKTLAEWREEARRDSRRFKAAVDERDARVEKYFMEVPFYQEIEAEVKEELFSQYGKITAEKVAPFLDRTVQLKEEFWRLGDFDDIANFDTIVKSRAILELCLDADPANEEVLKELIDVLQSGWPKAVCVEYTVDKLAFTAFQNKCDIRIAMRRLWSEHLSKRDASTAQDMAYAFDLVVYYWISPTVREKAEPWLTRFGLEASQELQELIRNGVSTEENMAIAEWAVAGAEKQGPTWEHYARLFRPMIEQIKKGERPFPVTSWRIRWDRTPMLERVRFLGTGTSFLGPASRKEVLEPHHVWLARHPDWNQ